jgi:hypothetical protein
VEIVDGYRRVIVEVKVEYEILVWPLIDELIPGENATAPCS